MSGTRTWVRGELYLSLETVAEIYEVQTLWLREVYEAGLLGRGLRQERSISIAAVQLDRVATIVRLHHRLGVDLETIGAAWLDR